MVDFKAMTVVSYIILKLFWLYLCKFDVTFNTNCFLT